MNLALITPGKLKKAYLRHGCADYLARLEHFARVQVIEVRAEPCRRGADPAMIARLECRRILARVPAGAVLIAFDSSGRQLDSLAMARMMKDLRDSGRTRIAFAIGGPLGLDAELLERADECLSLSKMTFPHELARLIVLEQLYRAFSIVHGQPYHKE